MCEGEFAPVGVLPTGAGKSVVIAGILDMAIRGNARALVLTHRQELLVQNRAELAGYMQRSELSFGLFCASLGSKTFKDVTFASVQSFAGVQKLHHQNLLIIDEAHLVGPKESTQYRKLIARLKALNPKLKIVGLTATPFRMGQGLITEGQNAIFTKIVYNANIKDLIDQGYLCHLTSKRTVSPEINIEGARIVSGDFSKKDLEPRVAMILDSAIPQILASGDNRKSWAVFTPSVAIAESVCGVLRDKGINAALLTGDTDTLTRNRMIDSFKAGRLRCIVSVDVMTTGFNAPNIDMIVLLRPTKSLGLYIQMVGRGTRLSPGKKDCLVLDFGGNIERFGPIDVIEIESKSSDKKKRKAPHKFCPVCGMSVALSVRTCTEVECQYEWPEVSKGVRSLEKYASDANILSEPELWHVNTDILLRLVKGGLPAIEIVYSDKNSKRKTSRFLCFDHDGFAKRKAVWWWTDNVGVPVPSNSEEARTLIESNWVPPESIVITKKGKYFEILKEIYGD